MRVILGLAVVAAIVWGAVYLAGRGEEPTSSATPSPSAAVSNTPSAPATTAPGPAVTAASADFPGTASADAASLQVIPLGPKDAKCTTHTVDGQAAYVSDCSDWGERAPVLYFFYVTLQNKGSDAFQWKRSAISVSSGDTFKPVDVSDQAADPATFLPKKGMLGSQDSISGYVVFEVDGSFDPSSLQYEGGGVTLTIQFVGATREVPAG